MKDNFTQQLSVKEILDELEISKDHYYIAFSISRDNGLEVHLKLQLKSCFVNNYFNVGLKACPVKLPNNLFLMSIRSDIMFQYLSKTEDQSS